MQPQAFNQETAYHLWQIPWHDSNIMVPELVCKEAIKSPSYVKWVVLGRYMQVTPVVQQLCHHGMWLKLSDCLTQFPQNMSNSWSCRLHALITINKYMELAELTMLGCRIYHNLIHKQQIKCRPQVAVDRPDCIGRLRKTITLKTWFRDSKYFMFPVPASSKTPDK